MRNFENAVVRFYEMLGEVDVGSCVRDPQHLSSFSALYLAAQSEARSVISLASQLPELIHLLAEFRTCIEGLAGRIDARFVTVCNSMVDARSAAAPKSVGPISP